MTVAEWNSIRRLLKTQFLRKGIVTCEICGSNYALSFAHRRKRRFCVTDEEKRTVILVCAIHHQELDERMTHQQMFDRVNEVIKQRTALADITGA